MRSPHTWLFVTVVIAGTVALPVVASAQQESRPAQQALAAGRQRIDIVVHGLSCPFCAYGLEKKLKKIEGLDSLSVDFKTGNVSLVVQDGSKASDERLEQLVKDAGFEVVKIERTSVQRDSSER